MNKMEAEVAEMEARLEEESRLHADDIRRRSEEARERMAKVSGAAGASKREAARKEARAAQAAEVLQDIVDAGLDHHLWFGFFGDSRVRVIGEGLRPHRRPQAAPAQQRAGQASSAVLLQQDRRGV